jgi:integration host factor subunit alpha
LEIEVLTTRFAGVRLCTHIGVAVVPENTLTRADIVDRLVQKVGLTKQDSSNFLERVLELVCAELERDEDVKFARFGNFVVRRKKARVGRNPKTGEEAPISARRVVSFKPSPLLRQRVEAAMTTRRD